MNKAVRIFTDWRLLGIVFVLAIGVALGIAISAAEEARDATAAVRNESETNDARTEADVRKARIIVHGQCARQEDTRRRIRAYMAESVRLAAETALPGAPAITQEQRDALDKVASTIVEAGESILPDIDCAKVAPLPLNLTDAEKAALPKSEPTEGEP